MGYVDNMTGKNYMGTILVIIFSLLKVHGVIDWSWWWVFSPWWIPLAVLLIAVVIAAITLILIDNKTKK